MIVTVVALMIGPPGWNPLPLTGPTENEDTGTGNEAVAVSTIVTVVALIIGPPGWNPLPLTGPTENEDTGEPLGTYEYP